MTEQSTHTAGAGSGPAGPGAAARRQRRPGLVLAIVLICQTMFILDTNVVNIALPDIQRDLGFSAAGLSWVLNAYMLAFGGLLLLGGRVGDIAGQRRALIAGVVVFTAASLAGGLATSPGMLLAARAGQGIGAAVAAPTVLALITVGFPDPARRARALGAYAAVSGSGAAIGLIAGGVLTDWISWRWVLFINVPIGVVLLVLAPLFITETDRQPGRFDLAGSLTSTLGMTALVYGFIRAAEQGFGDMITLGALGLAVVLLALFVAVESRARQPIVPLRLFADRGRAGGYVVLLFVLAAGNGMFFFLTQFLQRARDYSPLQAGFAFVPLALVILVSSGVAARLLPRWGARTLIAAGAAAISLALLWMTRLTPQADYVTALLGPMMIAGLGMGAVLVGATTAVSSGIRAGDAGAASGLLNAVQQIGGALGLAILVTVFGAATRASGGPDRQVLTDGVTAAFTVAAVFTAGAILLALIMKNRPAPAAGPAPTAPTAPAAPAAGSAAEELTR
ncbi:MFS transporter [Bailinhaonella thermotolerans]|uniref:MFS transporter n=1 Tax=Bailinhaonella thermotolerans TaxID=1070861 RepID=A0A3A4BJ89_9ACTN|nr:MFS transporter [Bailinhaonella thermotolerans]RJL35284.1 MFS transporter [Bailinhaonella thermotolerans]